MYSFILKIFILFSQVKMYQEILLCPSVWLPALLSRAPFQLEGRSQPHRSGGQQSERQDAPESLCNMHSCVCRKEGLFLFQLRGVLISSSFISYQETEANMLHHFCFYFSLSSAVAYTFCHLFPLSEQCHSIGRSCCLSSCYFDHYSCLCSTAAYLLNFACLKIIEDAAGKPAGS